MSTRTFLVLLTGLLCHASPVVHSLPLGASRASAQSPVVEDLTPRPAGRSAHPFGNHDGSRHPQRFDARGRTEPMTPPPIVDAQDSYVVIEQPPVGVVTPPQSAYPYYVPEPEPTPLPEPMAPKRESYAGYTVFGVQTGVLMGVGSGIAIRLRKDQAEAGAVIGTLGGALAGAMLGMLMHRWARNDHWHPGPGQALAGIYPGAAEGLLLGGSLIAAFDMEGASAYRTLGLSMAATALISMVLHRSAEHKAAKRASLYYVTIGLAALAALPFALAFDEPKALLYGTTAAGAVHLAMTGLVPAVRW